MNAETTGWKVVGQWIVTRTQSIPWWFAELWQREKHAIWRGLAVPLQPDGQGVASCDMMHLLVWCRGRHLTSNQDRIVGGVQTTGLSPQRNLCFAEQRKTGGQFPGGEVGRTKGHNSKKAMDNVWILSFKKICQRHFHENTDCKLDDVIKSMLIFLGVMVL